MPTTSGSRSGRCRSAALHVELELRARAEVVQDLPGAVAADSCEGIPDERVLRS